MPIFNGKFSPFDTKSPSFSERIPTETETSRPTFMGLAVPILVSVAIRPRDREARYGRRLASSRVPLVLDLEGSPRKSRTLLVSLTENQSLMRFSAGTMGSDCGKARPGDYLPPAAVKPDLGLAFPKRRRGTSVLC